MMNDINRFSRHAPGRALTAVGRTTLACGMFFVVHLGARWLSHQTLLLVIDVWAVVTSIAFVWMALMEAPDETADESASSERVDGNARVEDRP